MAAEIKQRLTSYLSQVLVVGETANVALTQLQKDIDTLTGTVVTTSGGNTVTGTSTTFTTQIAAGHMLRVGSDRKIVSAVTNTTHLRILGTWSANNAGATAYHTERVTSAPIALLAWTGDGLITRNSVPIWRTTTAGHFNFKAINALLDRESTSDLVITKGTANGSLLIHLEKRLA